MQPLIFEVSQNISEATGTLFAGIHLLQLQSLVLSVNLSAIDISPDNFFAQHSSLLELDMNVSGWEMLPGFPTLKGPSLYSGTQKCFKPVPAMDTLKSLSISQLAYIIKLRPEQ